ncbi:MAG: hypothetical protein M3209_09480 [Acidobacteriota bacterium]|nr:hypothetical protein [Acidobacteriota bacterium]
MSSWIGVIAAIVGAIVGGGIAIINTRFQLREQRLRERNKLFLSKLEEIHEVLSQFKESYKSSIHERLLTAHGTENAEAEWVKVPNEKLSMLVNFYATELTEHLNNVKQAQRDYSDILMKSVGFQHRSISTRKDTLNELFFAEEKIKQVCSKMQTEVVKSSKKYL